MREKQPLSETLSPEEWCDTARAKLEPILPGIDPALSVSVENREVQLYNDATQDGPVLVFSHTEKPKLGWSMNVEPSMDWIEHHLPNLVGHIYLERLLEHEDPLG